MSFRASSQPPHPSVAAVFSVLMKRFLARGGAKYALPWAAVPATAAWNALVGAPQQTRAEPSEQTSRERRLVMCAGNAIMREAKLRGLGVVKSEAAGLVGECRKLRQCRCGAQITMTAQEIRRSVH